ncbi:MAG: ankyrin repeat domain-containing protein [Pseudomonadota bacterium]|nr:ankyrin repeat domain-containing protein [Pseudomonadota bacterium]
MSDRFSQILDAGFKKDRRRLAQFSKSDYFADDPAAIQAEAVLGCIDDVIEVLAERGEFITEQEWFDKRHGHARNKSLCELAGDRGDHLQFVNGYVCNDRTRRKVPQPQRGVAPDHKPRFSRMSRNQEPATEQDNIDFWRACESGDMEQALMIWEEKDVNVNYEYQLRGDKERMTAIAAAARQGHDMAVLFLLEAGANPDSRTKSKVTPLMQAAMHCHDTTVMMVVDALVHYYHGRPDKLWGAIAIKERGTAMSAYDYALTNCAPATAGYIMRAVQRGVSSEISGDLDAMAEAYREEVARRQGRSTKPVEAAPVRQEPVVETLPVVTPPAALEPAALARQLDAPASREAMMKPAEGGKSVFRQAVEAGMLDKALQALSAVGGKLSKDDLIQREAGASNSNIELLADKGQLAAIFKPAYWINNVREMQEVWARVPRYHQSQLDGQGERPLFKRIFQEVNAASIRALQTGSRAVGEE